ncbi:DUF4446 family protein [bacterium]|nr:DUF4446 family protein [bacterium]
MSIVISHLFFILLISAGILVILIAILTAQVFSLRRRFYFLFQKGDKNLEEILREQFKKLKQQEEKLEQVLEDVTELKKISQKSFQKIGIVRFNPFKEVGGNQSFSIALLDANNNGFVITSHYGRELSRVYAKPVLKGKSQYSLSKEEQEAIEKAIQSEP